MEKQQILDAIYAAFPEEPILKARTIRGNVSPESRASVKEFLGELAGKSWRQLSPEFAAKWWAWFGYLRPDVYSYYIPALLTAALGEAGGDGDLMHSVVFELNPSFNLLYYEGEDEYLRANQAAFTTAQMRAVCDFLGMAFDQNIGRSRHIAAQALHWGWNRFDTPALAAAKAYYQDLRTFTYTESEDPEIAGLVREITTAFSETPYPGDHELYNENGEEGAEYAMHLRGVNWQSAHPDLLTRCDMALCFLTDAGFRYFLPAYLRAELTYGPSNCSPAFLLISGLYDESMDTDDMYSISAATDTGGKPVDGADDSIHSQQGAQELSNEMKDREEALYRYESKVERFRLFSRAERMAIVHYLEFDARDEFEAPRINQALERYWRPSLQSSKT